MFLISTILLLLILATEIFFVTVGKGVPATFIEWVSIGILISLIVFGVVTYFRAKKEPESPEKKSKSLLPKVFVIFSVLFVLASLFINLNKKAVVWDAVALYDARAKFMLQGVNFSEMLELSKYDPQNSYYYALYPPHTSILHYFWYSRGPKIPVGVMYSGFFVMMAYVVYTFTRKHVGFFGASFLTLLVVSNEIIFSSSLTEYTNLPFTLQILLGALLLYEYIDDKRLWKLLMGIGLVITTMWIRFLEPIWAAAVLAFLIALFAKEKFSKRMIIPVVMGLYGVLEYASWQGFVSGFGSATKIVSFSPVSLVEPFVGVLTGAFLSILIFFIKSWGIIFIAYLSASLIMPKNGSKINFLRIFLLITIFVYFAGLYFVSFQSEWWTSLSNSLVRSSSFMVPISGFILLEYLNGQKKK